jgi:LacI family transcriptional regulator
MPVRMKDIAEELGISQTTVSHVLRGRDQEFRINAGTARLVRETAARLDYRPSAISRSFKDRRSYSVCMAVGDLGNPFWAGLALGAQDAAERRGYTLSVIHTAESADKERRAIEILRDRRVDGLILSPVHVTSRHLVALREEGLPFVLVDRTIDGLDVSSVVTDSIAGMGLAVDHLVSRGHRRIAYLGGPANVSTFRDRLRGYRAAVAHHGLRPGPQARAVSDPEAARQAAERLFQRPFRATAVVGANLVLTVGLLRTAPEDVVVAGFDDLYLADLLRRPVTTVAQPVEELGRQAVDLLLDEIESGGAPRRVRHVVLQPQLIVRANERS